MARVVTPPGRPPDRPAPAVVTDTGAVVALNWPGVRGGTEADAGEDGGASAAGADRAGGAAAGKGGDQTGGGAGGGAPGDGNGRGVASTSTTTSAGPMMIVPGTSSGSTVRATSPRRTRSPGRSVVRSAFWPLTNTPLALPVSRMTRPSGPASITAWRREHL